MRVCVCVCECVTQVYRERTFARLMRKQLWGVAAQFVGSDSNLQRELVTAMYESDPQQAVVGHALDTRAHTDAHTHTHIHTHTHRERERDMCAFRTCMYFSTLTDVQTCLGLLLVFAAQLCSRVCVCVCVCAWFAVSQELAAVWQLPATFMSALDDPAVRAEAEARRAAHYYPLALPAEHVMMVGTL